MNLDFQDLSFHMDVNVLVGLLGVLRKRTQSQEFLHGPNLNTKSLIFFFKLGENKNKDGSN